MLFDLIAYAGEHRYRVRNLHDGLPVPPVRPNRAPGHRPAHVGAADRFDAIVCRHRYVFTDGRGIGWALLCRSRRAMTPKLRAVLAVPGVVVAQEGDAEAAGNAPVEALAAVLAVLRPWRHARRAELAGRKPPTATVYPRCAPGLGAPERGMDAAKANQVHKNMKQWTETRHPGRAEDSHKVDQSG